MMKRREFVASLGAAAIAPAVGWPPAAHAQQSALPVIGFLNPTSPAGYPHVIASFHRGLRETGYVEGQNVVIEYRWGEGDHRRMPALAAELVRLGVTVIASTGGDSGALAAKAATQTIPIVFNSAGDPVKTGLVKSLNRPGGNMTGVSRVGSDILPKRLEMIAEAVPKADTIAFLVNPRMATADARIRDVQTAAQRLGRRIEIVRASTDAELESAFAGMAQAGVRALLVINETFFNTRSAKIGALSLRHAIPAIYQNREFAAGGGLMSYGASLAEAYRLVGVYTGRILKGEKPADLPVQQQSKIEFIVNLKTARALGVTVPLPLLALADEVIE
jgi:putative ABC transport system substrate-binding protein